MRIPLAWAWLAATAALPSVLANGGSIAFNMDSILGRRTEPGGKVTNIINRSAQTLNRKLVIDWTSGDLVLVTIELRAFRYTTDQTAEVIGNAMVPIPTATTTVTNDGPVLTAFPTFTGRCPPNINCQTKRSAVSRAAAESFQNVTLIVTRTSATTGTVEIEDFKPLLDLEGLPLFFEASFVGGNTLSSQAFTVIEPADPDPEWTQEFFANNEPFPTGKIKPSDTTGISTPTNAAGSSSSSDGGLATGAIAGIAVGAAVIVLAFIGFLVWFFLRRRRQAKEDDTFEAYGNGRSRTDELMAEKEANAGADVSPHSPYSDDGGQRDSSSLHNVGTGAGIATAAVSAHHHKKDLSQSTFAPYSDGHETIARSPSTHAASIVAASSRGVPDSPIPGRATPHGVATPYAHLVEEGMTEDEIRRLEDEERALDAAIEQSAVRKP